MISLLKQDWKWGNLILKGLTSKEIAEQEKVSISYI